MWESFLGVLYGLATMHNQIFPHGYLCFHQDLKPSNLFLFGSKDDNRPFSYTIKIGDFGSSYSRSANPAFPTQSIPDKGATRIYGPPETFLGDSLNFKPESSVDIWAIGCIMIEMAVWITGGKLALNDFRRERMEETKVLPQHKSLGRSDCFHDASDVLNSVKNVIQNIEENRRQHDDITPAMVNLALSYVLIRKNERLHADQLIPKIHRILFQGTDSKLSIGDRITQRPPWPTTPSAYCNLGLLSQHEPRFPDNNPWSFGSQTENQSPASETFTSSSTLLPSPSPELSVNMHSKISRTEIRPDPRSTPDAQLDMPQEASKATKRSYFPFISINEAQDFVNERRNQTRELHGKNEAKSLLDGRDFIFLIDNSKYTNGHKDKIKTWTTSLANLLKTIDPDGIDVANTSSPQVGKTVKTRKDMAKFVDRTFARESRGDCFIENALNTILNPIKARWNQRQAGPATRSRNCLSIPGMGQRNKASRGVTVLVFTNGVCEEKPGGTCGTEKPILSLIDSMRKNDIPRTQVFIQSVRLCSEEHDKRRLEILDDELNKDFDIVDTKPTTVSIWDILIGPMQAGTDNKVATSS
ncbi:hypothetical protein E8E14_014851 [Neopestalotiopsis sp. 37M]|nr:hypothetical protein E8E14_014851 [Neopestalotiopsis sp. 37M]